MSQKNFRLVVDDLSALVRIEYEGGGEVPADLKGLYTDSVEANKAIVAYAADKGRDIAVVDKTQETVEDSKSKKQTSRPAMTELG